MYETEDDGWEAANVINSSEDKGNMTDFWGKYAWKGRGPEIKLTQQNCGYYSMEGCQNEAKEGGHVWLRRISKPKKETHMITKFCFIMPICGSCNRKIKCKNFQRIKKNVRLVARWPTPKMKKEAETWQNVLWTEHITVTKIFMEAGAKNHVVFVIVMAAIHIYIIAVLIYGQHHIMYSTFCKSY